MISRARGLNLQLHSSQNLRWLIFHAKHSIHADKLNDLTRPSDFIFRLQNRLIVGLTYMTRPESDPSEFNSKSQAFNMMHFHLSLRVRGKENCQYPSSGFAASLCPSSDPTSLPDLGDTLQTLCSKFSRGSPLQDQLWTSTHQICHQSLPHPTLSLAFHSLNKIHFCVSRNALLAVQKVFSLLSAGAISHASSFHCGHLL